MDQQRFEDLARGLGFRTDGSAAWGEREGYLLSLQGDGSDVLKARAAVDGRYEPTRLQLDSWLATAKAEGRISEYADANGSISVGLPAGGVAPVDIGGFLDALVTKLKELGLRPGCFNCNTAVGAPAALVNGAAYPLCGSCYDKLKTASVAAEEQRKPGPSAILRGLVGALAGGLLGSVLWILLGTIGFYASIAGLAIAWAASRGYTLLKGGLNRATPFVIGAVILFSVLFAEAAGIVIQLLKAGRSQGYDVGIRAAILALPAVLSDGDVLVGMLPSLGLGFLFAGLGSWRLLRNLHRQAAAPLPDVRRP